MFNFSKHCSKNLNFNKQPRHIKLSWLEFVYIIYFKYSFVFTSVNKIFRLLVYYN